LIVERIGVGRQLLRTPRVLQHSYALLIVMVGWVFFRADSISSASSFLRAMFGGGAAEDPEHPFVRYFDRSVASAIVAGVLLSVPIVPAIRTYLARTSERVSPQWKAFFQYVVPSVATLALVLLFFLGAMQMAADSYNPFIYFRF
jgi:alginate O-acetyltransferase complex protein AlgI